MVRQLLAKLGRRLGLLRGTGSGEETPLTPEKRLELRLRPYRDFLYKAQGLVLWEDPLDSAIALVVVNIIFGLITIIQIRFYAAVFAVLLGLVLHEAWERHIWPEIRVNRPRQAVVETTHADDGEPSAEGRLSVPELSHYVSCARAAVSDQLTRLLALRASQPALFCGVVCMVCLLVAGLGSTVSGLGLLYLITMFVMVGPGAYIHLVEPSTKNQITRSLRNLHNIITPPEGSVSVDDYLPESNKENLAVFAMAGDISNHSNGSSCVSSEESVLGSVMPSHEDSSMDALDSLSLDPTSLHLRGHQDSSSSSEDEAAALLGQPIRFKSTHFNGHEDSSLDDFLLPREAIPSVDEASRSASGSGVLGGSSLLSQALIQGALSHLAPGLFGRTPTQPPQPPSQPTHQDSDSDFEIIESEDVS